MLIKCINNNEVQGLALGQIYEATDCIVHGKPGYRMIDADYYAWRFEVVKEVGSKTLRDEFAMAAFTSVLSEVQVITDSTYDRAAIVAYKFADAMLKAREG